MKTLDIKQMTLDFTPAIPYINALETAENFPDLFIWCQKHEMSYYMHSGLDSIDPTEHLLEEAMSEIETYCPWLWPAIDRAILNIVEAQCLPRT